MKDGLSIFGAIALIVLITIFSPFINFVLCCFTGWLIKITFGATLCNGLALIGINLSPSSLPLLCGTLGVVGSFFKSTTTIRNKEK